MGSTSNPKYTKVPNPNPNGDNPNPNPNHDADSQNPNIKREDIVVAVLSLIVVIGLFSVIGWIIITMVRSFYHPDFPEFSVSSFQVSNFNLSSNSLSSDFDFSVSVRNPHEKWSILYSGVSTAVLYSTGEVGGDVDSAVLYGDDFVIAKKLMRPFSQGSRTVTDLEARLGTVGCVDADERWIRSDDGDLRFAVRVSAAVKFKSWAWETDWNSLKVYCDNIRVGLKNSTAAGAGSMVGPATGCRLFEDWAGSM